MEVLNCDIHARGPQRWAMQVDGPASDIRLLGNRLWTMDGPINGVMPSQPPTYRHIALRKLSARCVDLYQWSPNDPQRVVMLNDAYNGEGVKP